MRVFLRIVSGSSAGTNIPVEGRQFLIGRAADCQFRPHSDLVSAHHCQIIVEPTGVLLLDIHSKNGTFVDGQRVAGAHVLADGARLRIGPLELLVDIRDAENQTADTAPGPSSEATLSAATLIEGAAAPAALPKHDLPPVAPVALDGDTKVISSVAAANLATMPSRSRPASFGQFPVQVSLHVASGRNAGAKVPIKRHRFLIGRADDCHLRVHNDDASKRHCEILVQPNGALVLDLGSRNGTFVDGERITGEHQLADGAKLRVGSLELLVEIRQSDWRRAAETIAGLRGAAADTAASTAAKPSASTEPSTSTWQATGPVPATGPARLPDSGPFDLDGFLSSLPSDPAPRPPAIDVMAEIQAMNARVETKPAAEPPSTKETTEAAALGLKRMFTPKT